MLSAACILVASCQRYFIFSLSLVKIFFGKVRFSFVDAHAFGAKLCLRKFASSPLAPVI